MAITELGFQRRTYDEILTDKIAKAKELFGEDIDTSELTPLGKYIRINAYDQALTEEEAEQIYYSIFPNTSRGTALDRLCVFVGITRNAATNARYVVTFTGKAGAIIEAGFLVGTESGIEFSVQGAATINENDTISTAWGDVVIGESGTALATIECNESGGIGNVLVSEINKIINPTADINEVIGYCVISNGEEVESDAELRERFNEVKEGMGSCNESSIRAALLRIPTVASVGIIVNEENGSFECVIDGGMSYHEQIAETIFEKKPIGIKTTGTIEQSIKDNSGEEQKIKFSHTTIINTYVKAQIKTTAEFEGETGIQQVKDNLNNYIDNVGLGNPVILSSLYGQIYSVIGVKEVTLLQLSTDGSTYTENNITDVERYEKCACEGVEIEVIS